MTDNIFSPFWPRTAEETVRRYGGTINEDSDGPDWCRFKVTFTGVRLLGKSIMITDYGATIEEAAMKALDQFIPRHFA